MYEIALLKRAIQIFPRTDYTSPEAVRHARRKWLQSVTLLRARPTSAWILDQKVGRLH